MLQRTFSLVVVLAVFWAGLWLIGKAPAPDMTRLGFLVGGTQVVTVEGARTVGQAAGGAVGVAVGAVEARGQ